MLMKLDQTLLMPFCDHRRTRRQVLKIDSVSMRTDRSTSTFGTTNTFKPVLIPGDLGQSGGLPVEGSGGLAGN